LIENNSSVAPLSKSLQPWGWSPQVAGFAELEKAPKVWLDPTAYDVVVFSSPGWWQDFANPPSGPSRIPEAVAQAARTFVSGGGSALFFDIAQWDLEKIWPKSLRLESLGPYQLSDFKAAGRPGQGKLSLAQFGVLATQVKLKSQARLFFQPSFSFADGHDGPALAGYAFPDPDGGKGLVAGFAFHPFEQDDSLAGAARRFFLNLCLISGSERVAASGDQAQAEPSPTAEATEEEFLTFPPTLTDSPTPVPTPMPPTATASPTSIPTVIPTQVPTLVPSPRPTNTPWPSPTPYPTSPSSPPTLAPIPPAVPTAVPTLPPTVLPTLPPTALPTLPPAALPTVLSTRPPLVPTLAPPTPMPLPTYVVPATLAPRAPEKIPTRVPTAVFQPKAKALPKISPTPHNLHPALLSPTSARIRDGIGCLESSPEPFHEGGVYIFFCLRHPATVRLKVFADKGSQVFAGPEQFMQPGSHQVFFDATNDQGIMLKSGRYHYRLEARYDADDAEWRQSEFNFRRKNR
jgi:hypothetical protein